MKQRGRFDGVWNIVRFNWPMFAWSVAGVGCCFLLGGWWSWLGLLATVGLLLPLAISHWVYDRSDLYRLDWLDPNWKRVVSLHAGFDEISETIRHRLPKAEVLAFDFYDAEKHTEPSIERARRYAPPNHEVETVTTAAPLPVPASSVDAVVFFLSAHEIRDHEERARFFRHVSTSLASGGSMVVIEHIRDVPNFLAYSLGAFHFHSAATWLATFSKAGLTVSSAWQHTPLVRGYLLHVDN